jgi:hypothetical protein
MKNWSVSKALHNNAWIEKINLEAHFSLENLSQFIELWSFSTMFNSMTRLMTTMFGNSRSMGTTPRLPHTKCNFGDLSILACTRSFGRLGLPQGKKIMLGSLSKIGFGRPIGYKT